MDKHAVSIASYSWDEDDACIVLAVNGAAFSDVRVWWTPEGSFELFSGQGRVRLLLQLAHRLQGCSWAPDVEKKEEQRDKPSSSSPHSSTRLLVRLEKQHRGSTGVLLASSSSSSLPSAAAREQGLSSALPPSARGSGRRWRRLRDRVWLPLGYVQKLLHVTDGLDGFMWALMVILVVICPYTKVEESFAMQASHDFLVHGSNLAAYDHHEFPGVVARTFLGPLVLSLLAWPATLFFGMHIGAQVCVRIVLGTLVVLSLKLFRLELQRLFGPTLAAFFGLFCCTQFHLLFYMSRTLPNTFALTLVLLALTLWLQERYTRMLFLFTFTAVVFRFEVVLLLAPIVLDALFRRRLKLFWVIWCGVVFGLLSLAVTVALDSVIWGRLLWPEGSGLLFNVVENKSSLYGVSPWHFYFSSALPRALLGSFPLALLGALVQPRVRRLIFPAIVLVGAFSFLPHKELRFVVYAVPLLNVAAAAAGDAAWRRNGYSGHLARLIVIGLLFGSIAGSLVMAAASSANYPGGEAIARLHELRGGSGLHGASVWICNLACQTGVTRFLHLRPDWLYSKVPMPESFADFTFLISEAVSVPGFKEIAVIDSFSGIRKWPFEILMRPALRVFENIV